MKTRRFLLFLSVLIFACDLQDDLPPVETTDTLVLSETIQLTLPEPSGLSLDRSGGFLYCVNDPPNNHVYKLDLSGDLLTTYPFVGDDLEGVAFDPADYSIWVIEEGRGQLVHLSVQGFEISRNDIDYQILNPKHGFEGLCLRPTGNEFYALIESNPATIVSIDSSFSTAATQVLDFATDVSGICTGRNPDEYFIVSHEEQMLYEWSWDVGVLASYPLDIEQAEGVAYDGVTGTVYIVCDATARLYIYHFVEN